MSKRRSLNVSSPLSSNGALPQTPVDVDHLRGIAKAAIKNLLRPDSTSQRKRLHEEAAEGCDNLGVFLGRTTPTVEEVMAIIDDGRVVERVISIFSEQIAFARSVNDLKGYLPSEWDADLFLERLRSPLREALIARMRAAIELSLADVWRDSVNQSLTVAELKKAEGIYAERARRPNVKRKRGTGPKLGSKSNKLRKRKSEAEAKLERQLRENLLIKAATKLYGGKSVESESIKGLAAEMGKDRSTISRWLKGLGLTLETLLNKVLRA
jgi:hypothetical protein